MTLDGSCGEFLPVKPEDHSLPQTYARPAARSGRPGRVGEVCPWEGLAGLGGLSEVYANNLPVDLWGSWMCVPCRTHVHFDCAAQISDEIDGCWCECECWLLWQPGPGVPDQRLSPPE